MSEASSSLILQRELYQDLPWFLPGIGRTYTDHEIITSIGYQNEHALLLMSSFTVSQDMQTVPLQPLILTFPSKMAARILAFCEAAYMDVKGDYNCHTFVKYAMGWDTELRTGAYRYTSERMYNQKVEANQPYFIESPLTSGEPMGHVLLGTERSGYALNVLGPRQPLALSSTDQLMHMYGGEVLHRIMDYSPSLEDQTR